MPPNLVYVSLVPTKTSAEGCARRSFRPARMMSEAFSNWKLHFLSRERKCAGSNVPVIGSGYWGEWWTACRNQRSQAGWPLPHPINQHTDQVPSLRWGFWNLKCPMPCGHDSHESFLPHGSPWPGRAGQGALPKGAVTQPFLLLFHSTANPRYLAPSSWRCSDPGCHIRTCVLTQLRDSPRVSCRPL